MPNGVKVSIMLEETGFAYAPHRVGFETKDRRREFNPLNPNGKIPAIIDPQWRRLQSGDFPNVTGALARFVARPAVARGVDIPAERPRRAALRGAGVHTSTVVT